MRAARWLLKRSLGRSRSRIQSRSNERLGNGKSRLRTTLGVSRYGRKNARRRHKKEELWK